MIEGALPPVDPTTVDGIGAATAPADDPEAAGIFAELVAQLLGGATPATPDVPTDQTGGGPSTGGDGEATTPVVVDLAGAVGAAAVPGGFVQPGAAAPAADLKATAAAAAATAATAAAAPTTPIDQAVAAADGTVVVPTATGGAPVDGGPEVPADLPEAATETAPTDAPVAETDRELAAEPAPDLGAPQGPDGAPVQDRPVEDGPATHVDLELEVPEGTPVDRQAVAPPTAGPLADVPEAATVADLVDLVSPTPAAAPTAATAEVAAPDAPQAATAAQAAPEPEPHEQLAARLTSLRLDRDGRHELSINLRPAELGAVAVDVVVDRGTVHVSLRPEQLPAADLLRDALDDLRRVLAESGLDVGDLGLAPHGERRSGRDAGTDAGRPHRGEPTGDDGLLAAVAARSLPTTAPARGVDVLL